MLRAKQLGAVVFGLNTLFINEEMTPDSVMGEVVMSAGGTHIVYEAAVQTPYITLNSKEFGWILEAQRLELMTMFNTLGATYTLTYDDDTTATVRMTKEKKPVFTPLYEGSKKYTAVIPLAKVL